MKLTLKGMVLIPTTGKKGILHSCNEFGGCLVEYPDGTRETFHLSEVRAIRTPRPYGTKAQYAAGAHAPGGLITGYWCINTQTGEELSFHETRNQALHQARVRNKEHTTKEENPPSCSSSSTFPRSSSDIS